MKCANHPEIDAIATCNSCGKGICETCRVELRGESICKACVAKQSETQTKEQKSPALAAILSFLIAGVGQIYNGQIGKGLLIFFTSWLIIPWIIGIFDAYKTANRINTGEIAAKPMSGCLITGIVTCGVLFFVFIIISILAAIAIPSFIGAKNKAQKAGCVANLNNIQLAKEMYVIDYGLMLGDSIPIADFNGKDDGDNIPDALENYLDPPPACPKGGLYSVGRIGEDPACSIGTNNTAFTDDDHIL